MDTVYDSLGNYAHILASHISSGRGLLRAGSIKLHFPDRTAFVFLAHAFSSRGCNCYVQISYCDMETIVGVLISAILTVYLLFSAHLKFDLCTQMYLHACGVTFVPCDVTPSLCAREHSLCAEANSKQ